jgi:hypothetical protein
LSTPLSRPWIEVFEPRMSIVNDMMFWKQPIQARMNCETKPLPGSPDSTTCSPSP